MLFEGFLDVVDAMSVQGWVWCPANPAMRLTVALLDESFSVLARAAADQLRTDVAASGRHDGCYGFRIDLAGIEYPRKTLRAIVAVEPTWQSLSQEPFDLTLPTKRDQGNLDKLDGHVLKGWCQPADTTPRAKVRIHIDGRQEALADIGQYRRDLKEAGLGHGKWGFSCPIPRHLCDGQEHCFMVFAPDGTQLGQAITGRPPASLYSPYVGRCEPISSWYDPVQGWLCRIQGTVRNTACPDASTPIAIQAGNALLAVAFSTPETGAFSVTIPRDALLVCGIDAPISVIIQDEGVTLEPL